VVKFALRNSALVSELLDSVVNSIYIILQIFFLQTAMTRFMFVLVAVGNAEGEIGMRTMHMPCLMRQGSEFLVYVW
jgi:hypothetical protein